MRPEADLKVFLSHSHVDKRVARRLVRRLTAHGVKVWIDERKLRIGSVLTSSLRDQILAANVVLVIASQASAASEWVKSELEFALQHDKTIVPFFIEPVTEHERFHNHLGVDATSPQAFADAIHGLMRDLFLSIDLEVPPAAPPCSPRGCENSRKKNRIWHLSSSAAWILRASTRRIWNLSRQPFTRSMKL
jgi:hypothetical protein